MSKPTISYISYTTEPADDIERKLIESIKNGPQWPDTILPDLRENEIFRCTACGKDNITAIQYKLDYKKFTNRHGAVLACRSILDWKSDCCEEEFIIWDTVRKQEVPWPSDKLHDELRDGLIVHTTRELTAMDD